MAHSAAPFTKLNVHPDDEDAATVAFVAAGVSALDSEAMVVYFSVSGSFFFTFCKMQKVIRPQFIEIDILITRKIRFSN